MPTLKRIQTSLSDIQDLERTSCQILHAKTCVDPQWHFLSVTFSNQYLARNKMVHDVTCVDPQHWTSFYYSQILAYTLKIYIKIHNIFFCKLKFIKIPRKCFKIQNSCMLTETLKTIQITARSTDKVIRPEMWV